MVDTKHCGPLGRGARTRRWSPLRVMDRARCTLLLTILASGAYALQAQEIQVVPPEPACPECEISARLIAALGDDESGLVGDNFAIARDAAGRYLTSFPEYGSVIAVFDDQGRYVTSIGGRGQGPGEFLWVDKIKADGSRIHVFDTPAYRRTVLDLNLQVVGTSPLPAQPVDVDVLDDSLLVVNSWIPATETIGYPIHVLDSDGRVLRSMGYDGGGVRGPFVTSDFRAVTRSGHGRFWSVRATRYLLEKWNLEGERSKQMELRPPWLTPYEGVCCTVSPRVPPEPRIRQIHQDSDGLLWVLSTVADPSWQDALVPLNDPMEGHEWEVVDRDRFFDTIVDVIDPSQGRLIASARFDPWFMQFASDGIVASYLPPQRGLGPRIRVWRLSLRPSPRR
jgi:hypothetical protein